MNKIFILLVAGSMAVSVSADLTSFQWKGGRIFDHTGAQVTSGGVMHITTQDPSEFLLHDGTLYDAHDWIGQIYATVPLVYSPPFAGETYITATIDGSNMIMGEVLPVVYGIVDLNGGNIENFDYIGITAGFQTIDLNPDSGTLLPPQLFETGDIHANIEEVVPEPATVVMLGIGSFFILLMRRV